jgi:hypothetical protein
VTARMGDRDTARALLDDAVRGVARYSGGRPDHGHQRAIVFGFAARLSAEDGELDTAREQIREAYASTLQADDMPIAGRVGEGAAILAMRLGRPEHAAEMLGASMRLRGTEDLGNPDTAALLGELRGALGEDATAAAVDAGRALDRDAALARLDPATFDPP